MNYDNDNVKNKIIGSNREDWKYDDNEKLYTYNGDSSISIKSKDTDIISEPDFFESWAINHINKNAYRHSYELLYDDDIVKTYEVIGIDGDKVAIPMPSPNGLIISKEQYFIGLILNIAYGISGNIYEQYLNSCGINIR